MNKWIFLAVILSLSAVAVGKGGNWEYDNEHFHISVSGNGNVPKYTFYAKSDSGNKYQLRFQQLFEAENANGKLKKLGKSNIALPSQTWEWSSVVEIDNDNTTEYYFNITSYNGYHGNTLQYGMLRFVNRITLDNGTLYGKIDVEVDDYRWVSNEADAKLVLLFRYSQADGADNESDGQQSSGDVVTFLNAFFSINTTAVEYPSERNFSVTLNKLNSDDNGSDSHGMWVIYDHFDYGFRHDPSFGVNSGLSGGAIAGIVIAVVVVVAVGVVILVLFVMKKGPFSQYHRK